MSTEDIIRRIEACEEAINKLCDRSLEHKKNISNCAANILMLMNKEANDD